MLRLENITIEFNKAVLKPSSIVIPENAMTLIRGVSGSGKSSLLYRIGLISEDLNFNYYYHHQNLTKLNEQGRSQFRKEHISFVLQDNSLFDQYDVLGNMKLYASFNNKSYSLKDYQDMLRSVNLDISLHQSIQTLSGGQLQRLAIACALCKDSEIIILDEPTSNLDKENSILVFKTLKNICQNYHKTIIMASHDDKAIDLSDEIYEIKDQEIKEIKHYHEQLSLVENHAGHHFSFYFSYIIYFIKKYKSFEMSVITIITISLLLMNGLILFTDYSTNKSITSFQQLSDNQMFITYNDDNKTIDSLLEPFSFDNALTNTEVYPYIKTKAIINGHDYDVVPLFKQNDLASQLQTKYNDQKIYLSYYCFRDLEDVSKENKISFVMIVGDMAFEDDKEYEIGGVLKYNNECPYLKKEMNYIYCDYDILYDLYNQYHLNLDSYLGYTLISDDFNSYIDTYNQLKEEDLGVNLFFDHIDEMKNLENINTLVKTIITVVTFGLALVIVSIVVLQSLRKRDKEFMMLKMNGLSHNEMLFMMLMETAFQCIVSLFIDSIVMLVLGYNSTVVISAVYIVLILALILLIQNNYEKKFSVEKILRSEVD